MRNSGSGALNPAPSSSKTFLKKLLLGVLIVAAIAGLIFIIYEEIIERPLAVPTSSVQNVFVDINGDGLVDLIVKASVIINTGNNLNLPVSP